MCRRARAHRLLLALEACAAVKVHIVGPAVLRLVGVRKTRIVIGRATHVENCFVMCVLCELLRAARGAKDAPEPLLCARPSTIAALCVASPQSPPLDWPLHGACSCARVARRPRKNHHERILHGAARHSMASPTHCKALHRIRTAAKTPTHAVTTHHSRLGSWQNVTDRGERPR